MTDERLQRVTSVSSGIATAEINPERTQLADSVPVDNSNLLLQRYDKWIGAVNSLAVFVDEYVSLIQSGIKHYEKMNKSLLNTMIPQFDVDYSTGATSATSPKSPTSRQFDTAGTAGAGTGAGVGDGSAGTGAPAGHNAVNGINDWFDLLKFNVDANWKKYVEIEKSLKINIVPEFKKLTDDINLKKKQLISEQAKEMKELKKLHTATSKEISKLQNSTQVYANSVSTAYKIDYKNDPYFCNRSVLYTGDLQIQKENLYIDFLTNNEQNFEIFEKQLVDTIKKIFNNLTNLNTDLTKQQAISFEELKEKILGIDNDAEWVKFTELNQKHLISGHPYKRSLQGVTFPNDGHVSIEPILEGLLSRKEGKLKKNYATYFYVMTKTRYLYEFQSRSFKDSATPSLVFYLPHCVIGKPSEPQAEKFKFQIVGKDHTNVMSLTKKNLVLRASNYEEMMTWYNVMSEVSGQMHDHEESRLEQLNLDDSFENGNADTSVDSRV